MDAQQLRGIALYDSRKTSFVTSLEPLTAVEAGLRVLPLVCERYGGEHSHLDRLATHVRVLRTHGLLDGRSDGSGPLLIGGGGRKSAPCPGPRCERSTRNHRPVTCPDARRGRAKSTLRC